LSGILLLRILFNVNTVISAADQRCQLLLRSFATRDLKILTRAFIAYVRPILQYYSTVWSPTISLRSQHLSEYNEGSLNVSQACASQRLQNVGLCTLESRRLIIDLVTCYKIVFGLTCLRCEEFFSPSSVNTTRGHPYKLYVPFSSINARKYFFSNRVIEPWNNLNPRLVDFSSLKRFKCILKKIDFSPYLKYSCD